MDGQLISMLLTISLTFALGMIVYEAIFVYSFKRRNNFVLRLILCLLGLGGIAVGMSFGMYGAFKAGVDPTDVALIDGFRSGAYLIFFTLNIGILFICFDEKPSILLFAAVAAAAAHTIGNSLYAIWIEAFHFPSLYFTMYNGYRWESFVAYYLTHMGILFLAWLFFGRALAKSHKDFGKHINKFILGVYVIYAFFTVGISGSQYFNMTLMGIDTINAVLLPVIFNGFSVAFAVFVLFVQRFNLFWVKDVQRQEAAESFHRHYKDKSDKQQANMELVNRKLDEIKEQVGKIISKYHLDKDILDELGAVSADIFDASIQTGNDALDVLLTQKSLALSVKSVKTTAMIDGKALDFMDVADVNVFFGNAIDNAVEYLETLDEEKRFIRISSTRNRSLLMVRIENYCETDISFMKDGRPHPTKSGSQGYGTYSIRSVAEKYGGTATFTKEGNLFVVTALFSASEPF